MIQSGGRGADSPRRSGSNASQLFDVLVMAATGGTEGAAAAPAANDAPAVDSRFGAAGTVSPGATLPGLPGAAGAVAAAAAAAAANVTPVAAASAAAAAAAAAAATAATAASRGTGVHQLPSRQRSRLWSALSYGDVDSLQNALDAFRVSAVVRHRGTLPFSLAAGQQTGSHCLSVGSARAREWQI
jgi:hypothetical protein